VKNPVSGTVHKFPNLERDRVSMYKGREEGGAKRGGGTSLDSKEGRRKGKKKLSLRENGGCRLIMGKRKQLFRWEGP